MVRRGMRDFLALHDDLEVVGEAADGAAALGRRGALAPDVVVMDLLMPVMDGIAATAEIKARYPDVEVIALTSFIDEDRVTAAIEAGASGFLLKDAEADDLAAAIRAAVAGEVHLDPAVAGIVARGLRDRRAGAGSRRGARPGRRDATTIRVAVAARERASRPSPRASARSCRASRAGCRTGPSPTSSASPSGRPGPTCRTSSPSSAWRAGRRPRCSRSSTGWAGR